jgi:hypothetical protein
MLSESVSSLNPLTKTNITIDIITPAFDSGGLLTETVRSVVASRIDGLRFAIWDGKGQDGSCEQALALCEGHVEIHKANDTGQYDALSKGFAIMSGELMGWINAGDILFPWTLRAVAEIFTNYPSVRWIYGRPCVGSNGIVKRIHKIKPTPQRLVELGLCQEDGIGYLAQEAMFWRRDLYAEAGGIDASFDLAGDFDLWMRMAKFSEPVVCDIPLAMFAQHGDNRSQRFADKARDEVARSLTKLTPPDQQKRKVLSRRFALARRSARMAGITGRLAMRLLQLHAYSSRTISWSSRTDSYVLGELTVHADHLA